MIILMFQLSLLKRDPFYVNHIIFSSALVQVVRAIVVILYDYLSLNASPDLGQHISGSTRSVNSRYYSAVFENIESNDSNSSNENVSKTQLMTAHL
jgi:hypothetical protein